MLKLQMSSENVFDAYSSTGWPQLYWGDGSERQDRDSHQLVLLPRTALEVVTLLEKNSFGHVAEIVSHPTQFNINVDTPPNLLTYVSYATSMRAQNIADLEVSPRDHKIHPDGSGFAVHLLAHLAPFDRLYTATHEHRPEQLAYEASLVYSSCNILPFDTGQVALIIRQIQGRKLHAGKRAYFSLTREMDVYNYIFHIYENLALLLNSSLDLDFVSGIGIMPPYYKEKSDDYIIALHDTALNRSYTEKTFRTSSWVAKLCYRETSDVAPDPVLQAFWRNSLVS